MPVSGTYTWSETKSHVEVAIPLKGVSPKKVDVFTAPTILKVSYPPFLLDLNLYAEIDDGKSRAILKEGTLKIRLAKKESQSQQLWGQLCFEGSKDDIKERRHNAFKEREQYVQNQMEKVASKKVEEERMTFRKHMELEARERQRMDDVKEREKKRAEEAMYETFSQIHNQGRQPNLSAKQEDENKSVPSPPGKAANKIEKAFCAFTSENESKNQSRPQDCKEGSDVTTVAEDNNVIDESEKEYESYPRSKEEDDLPPPRQECHTTFRHTKRLFKTPMRESTAKQEQEFIMKNRPALRTNVLLNAGNNDISDVDPMWLKAKGDDFYNRGDFSSAINAYSEAIESDETIMDAWDSRAACYLHLREASLCINDCLKAMSLQGTNNSSEENLSFRKNTTIRLGLAYCLNNDLESGMEHFLTAQQLDKSDDIVTQNISYLKVLLEATKRKEDADRCFAEGEFEKAKEFYTASLSVDPTLLTALLNRAACQLALKNYTSCIEDCTTALELITQDRKVQKHDASVLANILSPTSKVRRKWMATLLCRRAAARKQLKDFSEALSDLEMAKKSTRPKDAIDLKSIDKALLSVKGEMCNAKSVV